MEWIFIAIIGAVIGVIVSFLVQPMRMPQPLVITIAVIGALLGGGLYYITNANINIFGEWSFYFLGVIVSIGFLAGSILAFGLTSTEKRV